MCSVEIPIIGPGFSTFGRVSLVRRYWHFSVGCDDISCPVKVFGSFGFSFSSIVSFRARVGTPNGKWDAVKKKNPGSRGRGKLSYSCVNDAATRNILVRVSD